MLVITTNLTNPESTSDWVIGKVLPMLCKLEKMGS